MDSCLVEREDEDLQNYLDCFAVALGDSTYDEMNVDLIGPWYVSTSGRSGKSYEFYALTAINRATGFPDGIMIKRKTSENVARKYDEVWLSRYPRPEVCAHDQGGELLAPSSNNYFMMQGLHQLLLQHEIHKAMQL